MSAKIAECFDGCGEYDPKHALAADQGLVGFRNMDKVKTSVAHVVRHKDSISARLMQECSVRGSIVCYQRLVKDRQHNRLHFISLRI